MNKIRRTYTRLHESQMEQEDVLELVGNWSVFELAKPSDYVIDDCAPRLRDYIARKMPAGSTCSRDYVIKNLKRIVAQSPKLSLRALAAQEATYELSEDSIDPELRKMYLTLGFQDRSFVTNFLMFCYLHDAKNCELNMSAFAGYKAYKRAGKDVIVTEQDMKDALEVYEYLRAAGTPWLQYISIYTFAYFMRVIETYKNEVERLQEKNTRLKKSVEAERSKKPAVKVVEKQVGADKLKSAEQEAQRLRNEMEAYKRKIEHDVRAEYECLIAEKDERIRQLEEQLKCVEGEDDTCTVVEDIALPDLPTSGVCVVGGHDGAIRRLKAMYPNWSFYRSTNQPLPTDCQYGLIFTKFCNHTIVEKFKSACTSAACIYTSSVNPQQALKEFQYTLIQPMADSE